MRPSAHFLGVLNQLQLRVRHAVASTGIGERRSRGKGSGMEFADYRAYVPGDDTRHLDARLHARLGDYYVREYEVLKQLPVSIVIDGSRSMRQGHPEKLEVARWLANALGYLALVSGDLVRVGFWSGRGLAWSPRFHGVRRADRLFEWVEDRDTDGSKPFESVIGEVASQLPRRGLAIILSDFWVEHPAGALTSLTAGEGEIWAFHILDPEELEPPVRSGGEVKVVDAETGEEVILAIDRELIANYRTALAEWRRELLDAVHAIDGTLVDVRADEDLEKLVLSLRARGLLT